MATPVPKNVAAAIGLVPTVLGGVRRLPSKAVQLPVMAVGTALNSLDAARREYGELADRGERLIAKLRGTSFDEVEDKVESSLSGTPVAKLYDRAEDALEKVFETSKDNAKQAVTADAAHAKDRAEANAAVQQALPVEDAPAAKSDGPVDSAASPEVVEQVEKIAANVIAQIDGDEYELPLPDYDGMTLGALRGRLRSLDMQQLVLLRDYEKSKAHRLPVITMLDNRIAKLSSGESAPTGSTPDTPSPKASTASKPPKTVGATAEAKNDQSPPHTKVRTT
ncbi:MAG: hypothetical protein QOI82_3098 [Actinomycetota bacterium]|jgi:hypothetical protein|nr:hypothetical protein [Actinomycetota bacterium]